MISTLIWVLAIFYASFSSPDQLVVPYHFFDGEDKLIHFAMYFGLMVLLQLTFILEENNFKKFVTILIVGIVLAVGTEVIQSYIPGRSASWFDLIANLVGLIAGSAIFQLIKK